MRIAAPCLLAAAIAFAAHAQPAEPPAAPQPAAAKPPKATVDDDVIGSLLDPRHKPTAAEEEEPDTASLTRAAPDVELTLPAPGARITPSPYAPPPPRSQRDRPVHVDETGKTPDSPPGERDVAYEARIRASFAAAESFQGPLDGGWTLAVGKDDLYVLQLVDKPDRLEGVWRDLRRKGSLTASGLVDDIQRQGGQLTLRFAARPGAAMSVATLHAETDGRWRGELEEDGQHRSAVLRRSGL